jgi:muconolactone delta-isomerase
MMETMILPSTTMLSQWVKDGKVVGGIVVGQRAGVFIVDAPSNGAVERMLQSLPFWPLMTWEVTPLLPLDERMARDKEAVAKMKAPAGK